MTNKNEQVQNASDNGPDMAGHQTATSGKNLSNDQKGDNQTENNQNQNPKSQTAQTEEKVLNFWQDNNLFDQTLEKDSPMGDFVFYDGPPFATGLPHYGHILAGIIKDAIPRYKTMKGYKVNRRWGWDCHGLPIENLIQKEHDLKTKKDIEDFGIKKFNQAAKNSVFKYDEEWKKIVPRTGRWVDMGNSYTTMDSTFSESVMWAFKKLYEKGLVYEDFKSMHISPALETPLSNFEVNQNYKDIVDISVYAKFALKDEKDTYLIAWTTTPWTLPANVVLAVGSEIDYVKVKITQDATVNGPDEKGKYNLGNFILAKSRLEAVMKDKKYEIISEFKGADLVGKSYEPIFDYYSGQKDLDNKENGWKIYAADFVTTEDGSGIVHIAPAFGEDDLNLAKANKLPFVQHVNIDGTIKPEVTDFAGRQAKPKPDDENPNKHQETDIEVIKYLAHHNSLFDKEKITHSYPHCWRTDAPLLNYALSSWFVRVTENRDKMIKLNKKVNWVPSYVGEKRFGNWLENIKDWGISRSRFWGTPIPIWRSEDKEEIAVIGSLKDLKEKTKSTNNYFIMRHGEGDHNVRKFLSSDNSEKAISHLTEKGKKDIIKNSEKLQDQNIDLIIASPLKRTIDTANLVAEQINFNKEHIIIDDRIQEIQAGVLNGEPESAYHGLFKNELERFEKKAEGAENLSDIRKRVGDFIYETDQKYQGKNILIVTHDFPSWMFFAVRSGLDNQETLDLRNKNHYDVLQPGDLVHYDFAPIPHDDDYILDYHRPYIDDVEFEQNGKKMKRVEDVFDTWFDSGSMPFAINHYPFEKDNFDPGEKMFDKSKGFPADFIAEGLDQTRGWFYTLLALNTALFKKAPYKNIIVNGLVLAEDGRKMSKRLQNYPDPNYLFDKYGADAARYYMISSPIVRAEPLNFSEKGVDEIVKKINNRLLNVLSFYEMYATENFAESQVIPQSDNILDQWILNRLFETGNQVEKSMEKYELDRATRPILDLVDDLSTWYLRRSRDRFKKGSESEKNMATKNLAYVLLNISKILAPFMPFLAEEIYQRLTGYNFKQSDKSVHLLDWPTFQKSDSEILKKMSEIRDLVGFALESRDKSGIRVRQPLNKITVSNSFANHHEQLLDIIKDEINVKNIDFDNSLKNNEVKLDTELSEELKQEGIARELIRFIQNMRKTKGLNPEDVIKLEINTNESGQKVVNDFEQEIKNTVNASLISLKNEFESDEVLEIEDCSFKIQI